MIALFSGRFDPLNLGHVETIMSLGGKYKTVHVVILDYDGRFSLAQDQMTRLLKILACAIGSYCVTINRDHFATIPRAKAEENIFDVYCSGNRECLEHMEEIGFKIEYVPRSGKDNSTELRRVRSEIYP